MRKIKIFYGSKKWFYSQCPKEYKNLTEIVHEIDNDSKNNYMIVMTPEQAQRGKENINVKEKIKPGADVLIADEGEYGAVREHVILNFVNFLDEIDVVELYLHNPPKQISYQLKNAFGNQEGFIEEKSQKYNHITKAKLKNINDKYSSVIIGQDDVKTQLTPLLYSRIVNNKKKRPLVLLFCGKPGIGKTETAKFISQIIGGALFRQQFSMFQNDRFSNYLFGGNHSEKSFAKDLLSRESDVILLDEFDKANPVFHSAFYQLFDDGIYEDSNYYLELKQSIIICTTNYISKDDIIKHLGEAIFNRFDAVIYFQDLSLKSKATICDGFIEEMSKIYKIDLSDQIKNNLLSAVQKFNSVREIRSFTETVFATIAFDTLEI